MSHDAYYPTRGDPPGGRDGEKTRGWRARGREERGEDAIRP